MKRALAGIVALLALGAPLQVGAGSAGDFDYYVLSLSWSPTWCASDAGRNDAEQCASGRRFAFVVHGLWPQYDRGWPQYCDSDERWVPSGLIAALRDIMPSKALVIHQWRKHGTCSGLAQADYFATVRRLFAALHIPARYRAPSDQLAISPGGLVSDFVTTNAGLDASMLSLRCGNARDTARLRELRVCYSRAGRFRACGRNEQRACNARILKLPAVR
jgi:ribonuclease T2